MVCWFIWRIFCRLEKQTKNIMNDWNRINEYNSSLNSKRCHFYQKEITYLGHWICDRHITPDLDRIKPILEYPTPKNQLELVSYWAWLISIERFYLISLLSVCHCMTWSAQEKSNGMKWQATVLVKSKSQLPIAQYWWFLMLMKS